MSVVVEDFTTKQDVQYCIDLATRDRQVVEACARVPGRLQASQDHDGHIAVVAYGPSLEDTWEQIAGFSSILTCSGAHDFLIKRGIVPTWHCAVDPLPNSATLIGTPHRDVEYLMASCCHRSVFDLLEGYRVTLFHIYSHEAARKKVPVAFDRGEWAITGGTNVGIRAILLARFLGFKKITVFGMDFSFKADGTQHAGWHPDERRKLHAVEADGEMFYTNPAMHSYATEFFKEITKLGQIDLAVTGHGLLQAQIREHCRTKPLIPDREDQCMIAATSPQTLSQEYLYLNRQLHESNPAYGCSGSKRTEVVKKLIEATKPESILDYGCGKSTLSASLPMPIWEYDPAIHGKDAPPRPADLVICTDVLEHVEPDYLQAVLLDLARCTRKVCFAVIHTGPSQKFLADGRNTHLIQEGKAWWDAQLAQHFTIAKSEMKDVELHVLLGPKAKAPKPATVPSPDVSQRVTPVRHHNVEAKFYTPNDQALWRAQTLFKKEPCTIDWIETMQPGDVLYDVGANVGGYSVWASQRKQVTVYAFEPESQNYALLCKNFQLNQVKGSAYCLAVSDSHTLSTLYCSAQIPGGSCHTFGQEVGPTLEHRDGIPQGAFSVTIDELTTYLPHPTHLKVDVDGLEHEVMNGAAHLLKAGTLRSLLVETNTNLTEHQLMVDKLMQYGYRYDEAQVATSKRKDGPFKGVAEYIFTKVNTVEQAVLDKIANAPLIMEPFPHLIIKDLFPHEYFEAIEWPGMTTKDYRPLSEVRKTHGYPERSVCKAPLSLSWMRNGRLRKVLDDKFGVQSMSDETLMLRDAKGYTISPHTDAPMKAVTMLVYVGGVPHGTSLYRPKAKGFTDPQGLHQDRTQFRKVKTVSGQPNSAFIFARTDTSFHGTETFKGPGVRDMLLYDSRRAQ